MASTGGEGRRTRAWLLDYITYKDRHPTVHEVAQWLDLGVAQARRHLAILVKDERLARYRNGGNVYRYCAPGRERGKPPRAYKANPEYERAVIDALWKARHPMSVEEVAAASGLSLSLAYKVTLALVKAETIKRASYPTSTRGRRFWYSMPKEASCAA